MSKIDELQAELAARDHRIATLESRLAAQPAGGTVMVRELTPRVDHPTTAEMARLYQIVTMRWPRLAHAQPERGLQLFASAFSYLASSVSHSDKRSQYSAGSWVDRAEAWLRARARPADMSWAAICAAAVCLGFGHARLDGHAYEWELWASEGSHRLPSPQSWRAVLAGQALRPPMPFETPRAAERPPMTIRCGSGEGRMFEAW